MTKNASLKILLFLCLITAFHANFYAMHRQEMKMTHMRKDQRGPKDLKNDPYTIEEILPTIHLKSMQNFRFPKIEVWQTALLITLWPSLFRLLDPNIP